MKMLSSPQGWIIKKYLAFIALYYFFAFAACRVQLDGAMPDFSSTANRPAEIQQSNLSLPIQIPLKIIEDEINRQFSGIIYEDMSYDEPEKDDVMVRIRKTRDIRLQALNEFVRYEVPVGIWAKYRWKACEFCPQIEKETSFNILIAFTSKIDIQNNWRIDFRTSPTDIRFETNPYLDFGPIRIPVRSFVEPIVREQINDVTKEIDREMASLMDLSSTIDSVWRELHEPQLLDSAYKAWLCITPSQVLLSPLRSNNESIRIMAGFRGIIKIVTGEKPLVSDIRPLPLITMTDQINQDFNIFVESHIGLQEASEIARSHLKDTVFEFGSRRSVKIEDIAFAGYGSKVYTKVDLSQSIRGSVYFIGTPAYDRVLQEVYFRDFDFELRTKNALLKSAGWLMHGTFKRAIEKEFRYNIADDLKEIRGLVDNSLKDYDFDGLFTLNGRLSSIDIHDIIVEYNTLRLIVDVKGRAVINIKSLDF